ncbi:hypothetical protein D3C71_1516260 [compost metagenome]
MAVGAVEGKSADRVADLGIGKAPFTEREIVVEIGVGHGGHDGNDLFGLHLPQESRDQRMLHGLMHEVDVEQARRIGNGGVAAIEDADLHVFVGRHVRHELHADLFQRRAAGGEIVLEHPLPEAFAENRPIVGDPEIGSQQGDLPG